MHLLAILLFVDIVISRESCYFDSISSLKPFDRQLNGRQSLKRYHINSATTLDKLVEIGKHLKSNGNDYSSNGTSAWMMEILKGFAYRITKPAMEADYSGQKIRVLFETIKDGPFKDEEIIFEMRLVGPLEHSWIVHKLPKNEGYRVYQSYTDSYSLNAWLTDDYSKFVKLWHRKDIMYWSRAYNQVEIILSKMGFSLTRLYKIPLSMAWMKPWLKFVKNLNRTRIFYNLERSWRKFGAGKIISEDVFFKEYLTVLANVTESIEHLVGTAEIWTSLLDEQWILLFGAANPNVYPRLPFNMMTQREPPQKLQLQIHRIVMTPTLESSMRRNTKLLSKSVNITTTTCYGSSSMSSMIAPFFHVIVTTSFLAAWHIYES